VPIRGSTLRLIRVFRGLTQKELAEQVSVSEAMIWQVERGKRPSEALLSAIGTVVGVEPAFFFDDLVDEFTEGDCNFRTRIATRERVRKRVLAQGTLFAHLVRAVQRHLSLPKYNVPELVASTDEQIERAAEHCRSFWKLGTSAPITHMGRVLENAGVMVTRLRKGEPAELDAFSRRGRDGGLSFVVLNPAKGSTSRTRFDMAHELGHLVLHASRSGELAERERQANRFASAFLLPQRAFRREFWSGGRVDWTRAFELKKRWKTSVQAIVYRAFDLDLIDLLEFRKAYRTMSARGWLKGEPEEPQPEPPELFAKTMHMLWEKKRIGAVELAQEVNWTTRTLEDVTGWRSASNPGLRTRVLSLSAHKATRGQ
jgi:Zn-dependent peptidase ImmA (M78 family)/transcriptional regulator with XRE-family HTH domain